MKHFLIASLVLVFTLGCPLQGWAVELRAGVAKGVITNDTPRVMVNGRTSEGTAKDIYARVLTLHDGENRLIFVTYDLNCLDVGTAPLRKRVEEELGMPHENLILLATHNHSAPIQILPENYDYGHFLADTIWELILEAIDKEDGPVTVEYGQGHAYFIVSSGNAPTDSEIQLLKVSKGDQPIAVLFNHPTHPIQAARSKVEPGHPGWAMDNIEAALPGVQAMYCDAAGGNQFVRRPRDYQQRLAEVEGDPEAVDAYMQEVTEDVARQLSDATLDILNSNKLVDVTGPLSSSFEIIDLPLAPPVSEEEARKMAEDVPMDIGYVHYPHPDRRTNWIRMLNRYYDEGLEFPTSTTQMVCTDDTFLIRKDDTEFLEKYADTIDWDYPCVYQETIVARIGDMPFVAMQGEVCTPIGMRIKDAFRADGPIFVTAYMGEHNLYIPTREIVRLDAYQAQTLRIQYASPVGWDPSVEDVKVNAVIDMIERKFGTDRIMRDW